jgi:hypothetical protein
VQRLTQAVGVACGLLLLQFGHMFRDRIPGVVSVLQGSFVEVTMTLQELMAAVTAAGVCDGAVSVVEARWRVVSRGIQDGGDIRAACALRSIEPTAGKCRVNGVNGVSCVCGAFSGGYPTDICCGWLHFQLQRRAVPDGK